ncbi:MAG: D-alanyl-D-alanine carboxypeptidase [Oscillospiraceae bacterium]|nr:D-alanyl-D-alanine carboxypeptidase [Oscillospiraceae bacterium]
MRKMKFGGLLLCLCLLLQSIVAPVSAVPTNTTHDGASTPENGVTAQTMTSVVSGSHSVDAGVPLCGSSKLLQTAGAAMLYETNSDTMMYAWNPDTQLEPASLVKIMTALLAVEKGNLSDSITVSANAIASLPSNMKPDFQIGEVVTLEQLLYCLMVDSSNDAALVIAHHIAGSQQGFHIMMNQRAQELGCTNTNFMNAHGLHDEKQYTTARDMVKILREASKNALFMKFFSAIDYTMPATNMSESKYMITTNYMIRDDKQLYYERHVTGGRTGVTDARRRCLIVTATSGSMSYIAVVLDAIPTFDENGAVPLYFGSYEETKELLNLGFNGYAVTQVISKEDVLIQHPVMNGDNHVALGPEQSVSTVLPADVVYNDLSIRYQQAGNSFTAPVAAGVAVNSVQVWYKNICVAESPIVTKNAVSVYSEKIQQSNAGGGGFFATLLTVLGVLLVLAVAGFGVLYIRRLAQRSAMRAQHRRRRMNRRRSR